MRTELRTDDSPVWRLRLGPGDSAETAIDPAGTAELNGLLGAAEASPECRVVVLEGAAGSFCKGMDLDYLTRSPGEDFSGGVVAFSRTLSALRSTRKLVVAVVDGPAVGGGVGLAAASDILVASSRASFALPEVVLGLLPAVILPTLLDRMSPQKARAFALSSGVDAARALELGLVDRVVEDPNKLERALRGVIKHALRCHPEAVAGLKRLCGKMAGMELEAALRHGADQTARLVASPETVRSIRDFLEGEQPDWFDRYRPKK